MVNRRGILFVVSGPSGAGKSTLCEMVVEHFRDARFSVSYTTRRPRADEKEGVDYRFVSEEDFERMQKSGEFLEEASVHSRKYGTSKKDLDGLLLRGSDVVMDIDVQGAVQMKNKSPKELKGWPVVFIFVLPPSISVARHRLGARGDIEAEEMNRRVEASMEEISKASEYDYIILNDDLDASFEKMKSIVRAERTRKDRVIVEVRDRFGIK